MADEKTAHYFFEYDRPPSPKTGRPRKPGRTTWRMTIEHAAKYHPSYRPILETVEYRDKWDGSLPDNSGYEPGTGPVHWGKGNLDWQGRPIKKETVPQKK